MEAKPRLSVPAGLSENRASAHRVVLPTNSKWRP